MLPRLLLVFDLYDLLNVATLTLVFDRYDLLNVATLTSGL
jgi:hypothetical protein